MRCPVSGVLQLCERNSRPYARNGDHILRTDQFAEAGRMLRLINNMYPVCSCPGCVHGYVLDDSALTGCDNLHQWGCVDAACYCRLNSHRQNVGCVQTEKYDCRIAGLCCDCAVHRQCECRSTCSVCCFQSMALCPCYPDAVRSYSLCGGWCYPKVACCTRVDKVVFSDNQADTSEPPPL